MKITTTLALAGMIVLVSVPAFARGFSQPDERTLDHHGRYTNSDGRSVHQPAHSLDGAIPVGASARCRDGEFSFSQHHAGTCSGHHGVATWLR